MLSIEYVLVGAAVLLVLSVLASRASTRLGVPVLIVFLLVGMLAGSEGPGGIAFEDYRLAQSVGVVALVFILFAGGLDTDWKNVRPVLWQALVLSTIGVLITALLVGWFATAVLGFSLLEGVLLGAIVSSTDAAAVFAILRSRGARLKGQLAPLLELESGSNDPMAVFLTTGLISLLVSPGESIVSLVPMFVLQMSLGAAIGFGMGRGATWLINRSRLEYDGLYPVLLLALVLLIYSVTAVIGGNGFLAVYIAGLVMGNSDFVHKGSLMRFHDGLAWLMQIVMFLTLGLLVFPSRLVPVIGAGMLIAIFLMVVARPVAVSIGMALSRMSRAEKTMVAWVGLRGAVPIILATFPLLAGIPQADTMFHLVFFIVLTSVLVQGTSLPVVARWLDLAAPLKPSRQYSTEFVPSVNISSEVVEIAIPPESPVVGKAIVDLKLPKGALVVLINRDDDSIIPNGGTVIKPGDTLVVLADPESLAVVQRVVERGRAIGRAVQPADA